jgi:thiol-disulfide isomerase/thioredoxin
MRNFGVLFFLIVFYPAVKAIEVNDQAKTCPATIGDEKTPLDLQQYQGKVLYLDFWATWCPPCKKSMPFLNALRNELLEQGFEIIAINVDEKPEDALSFLQQYPVDYVMAMDPSGQCPELYDVMAMPSAYFIDRQGKVRYIHLGFRERDEKEIRHHILELLAEKGEKS